MPSEGLPRGRVHCLSFSKPSEGHQLTLWGCSKSKGISSLKNSFKLQKSTYQTVLLQLSPCQISCNWCANPSPVWTLSAPTRWIWSGTTRQRTKMKIPSSAPSPGRTGCATVGVSQHGGKRVWSAPWITIPTMTPPTRLV